MTQARTEQLRTNLEHVRAEIQEMAGGQQAPELLIVTKFHPAADIALLAQLGVTDVAENREQEARAKYEELGGAVRFHMIGQVQTKKANHVARWAASVHSVDSVKLAHALDRGAQLAVERGQRDGVLPVFIQVSVDEAEHRGGVGLGEDLDELVAVVEDSPHLRLEGLMVVPPLGADAAAVFRGVRELTDGIGKRVGRPLKMSAGMSGDMVEAIAAGTDIVRVGTRIMGPRPLL